MLGDQRYRINSPYVVHETIEGEVIMVNLDTGSYYSLDGAGALLWEQLGAGATLASAVDLLRQRYQAAPDVLQASAGSLLSELLAEELLLPLEGAAGAATVPPPPAASPLPFVAPVLHKHTDMQDLLLLDPIHEVDQAGWPAVKP